MTRQTKEQQSEIKYKEIGFEAAAGGKSLDTCLHGTIIICGSACHLEAYQVTEDDDGDSPRSILTIRSMWMRLPRFAAATLRPRISMESATSSAHIPTDVKRDR